MQTNYSKEFIVSLFKDDVEARKKIICEYIMNEDNSFEDRKEVWLNTPGHLYSSDSFILHLDEYDAKYGEISWSDAPFYAERHTEVDLTYCAKSMLSDLEYTDEDKIEGLQRIDDFIANCMKLGCHSFTLDW
jgi:hypothetical protein